MYEKGRKEGEKKRVCVREKDRNVTITKLCSFILK